MGEQHAFEALLHRPSASRRDGILYVRGQQPLKDIDQQHQHGAEQNIQNCFGGIALGTFNDP